MTLRGSPTPPRHGHVVPHAAEVAGGGPVATVARDQSHPANRPGAAHTQPVAADDNFRVVCLGGSAGGLQGYLDILGNVPANTGMVFVIAPHRALEGAEMLLPLLARVTAMPVVEVAQGMRVEPNRVFVMPPHMDLTATGAVFQVRTISRPPGWPKTISIFLCSLAEVFGPRAVAVILSGLDHDGSAALKAIKAAGGVTFAQSDASHDDMPRHAVETGHVDYLLPAREIATALLRLAASPPRSRLNEVS